MEDFTRARLPSDVVEEMTSALREAVNMLQVFESRFVIPEDFLPDHPDRDKMIVYLKARSWKGTDSGAADSARVPLRTVRQWRQLPEFVELEQDADEACTDLAEEVAMKQAVMGDTKMLDRVLKGRRKRVYNDRVEVTGQGGGPVSFEVKTGSIPRPRRVD